ncbi:hypothetical protein [Membranihabitans maritimus]|uniref:hypothetical protein n=1 Tax=Membranihabitans maritimus TaxID=2904244 RepID=UPI001F1B57E7|nr:hypothetical protein [Membranihabitans maritimus]
MIIFSLIVASFLLYANSRYFQIDWPYGIEQINKLPGLTIFIAYILLGIALVHSIVNFGLASAILILVLGFSLITSLMILVFHLMKRGILIFVVIALLGLLMEILN